MKIKFARTQLLLFLIITCSACSSESEGLINLKRLCKKDAGLTVNNTVEAKGFYDDTTQCHHCWHELINTPFEYVEYCDFESERHPLFFILKDNGCYRLSKVKRASSQCHAEIDKELETIIIEPFSSFNKEYCIKVESIEKPSSGLGLFLNYDEGMISKKGYDISRYEYTIKSLNDNKQYGKLINYSLVMKTVGGAGYSCSSFAVTGKRVQIYKPSFYKSFIGKVIK